MVYMVYIWYMVYMVFPLRGIFFWYVLQGCDYWGNWNSRQWRSTLIKILPQAALVTRDNARATQQKQEVTKSQINKRWLGEDYNHDILSLWWSQSDNVFDCARLPCWASRRTGTASSMRTGRRWWSDHDDDGDDDDDHDDWSELMRTCQWQQWSTAVPMPMFGNTFSLFGFDFHFQEKNRHINIRRCIFHF